MALIDMSDCFDSDNCENFALMRQTGQFVSGGYVEQPTALPRFGVISAPTGNELSQVPEGDRVSGAIVVHTWDEIMETNPNGTSDELVWNGQNYRVAKVWPYFNRGYWKAYAVRTSGK